MDITKEIRENLQTERILWLNILQMDKRDKKKVGSGSLGS